ncbi:hypothetical protein RYX36_011103 [Vicia faba]
MKGNNEFMVSHTTTTNNNNDIMMMPPPSSSQPSSDKYKDFPQDSPKALPKSSSKKRMGRPLGSKNRPKARIVIEEDKETSIEEVTLQIPLGEDIVENIIKYSQQRQANIIVSMGFGLISNITFLDPVSRVPLLPIEGPVHMTSLFGTYINPNCECPPRQFIIDPPCSSFTVYFSSPNGYVFGGIVGGNVNAAGVILINATLVWKTAFHRAVSSKRNVREIEEGGPVYASCVITGVNHASHESDNNNNNNNVFHAPTSFNGVDANSTQLNYQLPPHYLHTDENVIDDNFMQWNNSSHPYNY